MRVLFDIVHPADVLFYLHSIRALEARGDDYLILSRHKDVTCDLLDEFGLSHVAVSSAGCGTVGLALELVKRDLAIFNHARDFKPDIMIGFGGVAISHVGAVLKIPSISFYDTDTAVLQNRLTHPFISHLYVPESYTASTPKGRTTWFKGIKELSYFHSDTFQVDEAVALANGWDPSRQNFFIRAVMWRANHDIGKSGWDDEVFIRLIEMLSKKGRVHISSERVLPESLEPLRYNGAKTDVHHLIAKCDLYVGESATMAQEAAFLGIQAIYDGYDVPCVTQEMSEANLLSMPTEKTEAALVTAVNTALEQDKSVFKKKLKDYMISHPNLTSTILMALEKHAKN